ncbi:hypothetical protein K470DRAFT_262006 [Piedraia hortae CBS 480.64]|uniref:Uncharacterized protein n=1 Tax=Piedraia hortae CBS 480.64 TaxID=1314780 RepID=A0A6A7C977_9PEZI|nr:hypothetical protein K470DRAFT_262006 [Piedraia hortae CBS 480.64]
MHYDATHTWYNWSALSHSPNLKDTTRYLMNYTPMERRVTFYQQVTNDGNITKTIWAHFDSDGELGYGVEVPNQAYIEQKTRTNINKRAKDLEIQDIEKKLLGALDVASHLWSAFGHAAPEPPKTPVHSTEHSGQLPEQYSHDMSPAHRLSVLAVQRTHPHQPSPLHSSIQPLQQQVGTAHIGVKRPREAHEGPNDCERRVKPRMEECTYQNAHVQAPAQRQAAATPQLKRADNILNQVESLSNPGGPQQLQAATRPTEVQACPTPRPRRATQTPTPIFSQRHGGMFSFQMTRMPQRFNRSTAQIGTSTPSQHGSGIHASQAARTVQPYTQPATQVATITPAQQRAQRAARIMQYTQRISAQPVLRPHDILGMSLPQNVARPPQAMAVTRAGN